MKPKAEKGTAEWLIEEVRQVLNNDGIFLTFAITGVLGVTAEILNDWTWEREELGRLPHVEDEEGRRFYFRRVPGGQEVAVYLPTGRVVRHAITSMASRDLHQLEAEVMAIVEDNYRSTT